jgi:hypothetical protein
MEGASKRSGAAQAGNGGKMQMHANSSRERGQRYIHSKKTFLQLFGCRCNHVKDGPTVWQFQPAQQ